MKQYRIGTSLKGRMQVLSTKEASNFVTVATAGFMACQVLFNFAVCAYYRSDTKAAAERTKEMQSRITGATEKSSEAHERSVLAQEKSAGALKGSVSAQEESARALAMSAQAQVESAKSLKDSANAQAEIKEFYKRYEKTLDSIKETSEQSDRRTANFQDSILKQISSPDGSPYLGLGSATSPQEAFYERMLLVMHQTSWNPSVLGNKVAEYRQLENSLVLRDSLTHGELLRVIELMCGIDKPLRELLEAIPENTRQQSTAYMAMALSQNSSMWYMPAANHFVSLNDRGLFDVRAFDAVLAECILAGVDRDLQAGWQCVIDSLDGRTAKDSDINLLCDRILKERHLHLAIGELSGGRAPRMIESVKEPPSAFAVDDITSTVKKYLQIIEIRQRARLSRFDL